MSQVELREIRDVLFKTNVFLEDILREIRIQNESMTGGQVVKTPAEIAQAPRREGVSLKDDIEARVRQIVKDEKKVSVVEQEKEVLVVLNEFLERDIYQKLDEVIKGRGGRYYSARDCGGQAHFVIPKGD